MQIRTVVSFEFSQPDYKPPVFIMEISRIDGILFLRWYRFKKGLNQSFERVFYYGVVLRGASCGLVGTLRWDCVALQRSALWRVL